MRKVLGYCRIILYLKFKLIRYLLYISLFVFKYGTRYGINFGAFNCSPLVKFEWSAILFSNIYEVASRHLDELNKKQTGQRSREHIWLTLCLCMVEH